MINYKGGFVIAHNTVWNCTFINPKVKLLFKNEIEQSIFFFVFQPSGPLERKNDPFGAGSSSSKWDFDQGNTLEQIYREEIRKTRQKRCSRGLCIPNLDNLSTGGYRQMSRDDL